MIGLIKKVEKRKNEDKEEKGENMMEREIIKNGWRKRMNEDLRLVRIKKIILDEIGKENIEIEENKEGLKR